MIQGNLYISRAFLLLTASNPTHPAGWKWLPAWYSWHWTHKCVDKPVQHNTVCCPRYMSFKWLLSDFSIYKYPYTWLKRCPRSRVNYILTGANVMFIVVAFHITFENGQFSGINSWNNTWESRPLKRREKHFCRIMMIKSTLCVCTATHTNTHKCNREGAP